MNATISISSSADGEKAVEIRASGEMELSERRAVLRYKENPVDMGETYTELTVEPQKVVLTRTGEYGSQLVFIPNVKSSFTIRSPYGDVPMSLYPETVTSKIGKKTVSLTLEYVVYSGGMSTRQKLDLRSFPSKAEG